MKGDSASISQANEIRALLAASRNLAAVELAREACAQNPGSDELLYLYALGCLRSGALDKAEESINRLRGAQAVSLALQAEVEGLAGRLAKERFAAAKTQTERELSLNAGIAAYMRADGLQPNRYACINAATLVRLKGAQTEAEVLARNILEELQAQKSPQNYWDCATQAEALLLTGEADMAAQIYREAGRMAGLRFGEIASMRRQLFLLLKVIPQAQLSLDAIPGPSVIAFTGHMIDTDDRTSPRFPEWLESAVQTALDQAVEASAPVIAYSQAACGSDILFCECMLTRSHELNIVLPFAKSDYIEQSVLPGGAAWLDRFERVMAAATSITYATEEGYLGDDSLFEHASNLIQGMAFLRARELAVKPSMLVVADTSQTGGQGGTLATQAQWATQADATQVIDLAALRSATPRPAAWGAPVARRRAPGQGALAGGRTIKSLLFADVKGFSRLSEAFFPAFFTAFLGLVPRTLQDIGVEPPEISSRGDGLYAVFDKPDEAANFALTLSASVGALDWVAMGLPADTHVRIALHAGPVFIATDPVNRKLAHYGVHVTRAARVEPIVIPGQVLVTEPFAALISARSDTSFACDLVGIERLAKDYGDARLYRLRCK